MPLRERDDGAVKRVHHLTVSTANRSGTRQVTGSAAVVAGRRGHELFTDRARRVCPNSPSPVHRGHGDRHLPATRQHAVGAKLRRGFDLSPAEILDSLHDRFRLLTGSARTAVRRRQALCSSVD